MHRNMYQNKYYYQDSWEHHSFIGRTYNNRKPPTTGNCRPPKSCNTLCYNKSTKNGVEKPTKVSHKKTSCKEGPDFGKAVNLWEKIAVSV